MDFRDTLRAIRSNNKKVLVVGLGISGLESLSFLHSAGISVIGVEREEESRYLSRSKFLDRLEKLNTLGVPLHFGVEGEKVKPYLEEVSLAVLSPGVPLDSSICGTLSRFGIQMVSELELGIELSGGKTVVVTGSNGKSTTVTLIETLLREGGLRTRLCGNVGTPVVSGLSSRALDDGFKSDEVLIVEASSYQLESCTVLKPTVGVLLNLSENHLERHGTMERYRAAKAKVFVHQDSGDLAILNADDVLVSQLKPSLKSKVLVCGQAKTGQGSSSDGAYISYLPSQGIDKITFIENGEEAEFSCNNLHLLGLHNRYNVAVSILAARELGVSADAIRAGLSKFSPLEHRIEFVYKSPNLTVINDSKSTTVAASCAAIEAICEHFPGQKIRVLLGGLSKAGSWVPVIKVLKREIARLRPVVSFGKDGNIIGDHLESAGVPFVITGGVRETVQKVIADSIPGEIVLFTPGCASFDEFKDFEERGRVFKEAVLSEIGKIAA